MVKNEQYGTMDKMVIVTILSLLQLTPNWSENLKSDESSNI